MISPSYELLLVKTALAVPLGAAVGSFAATAAMRMKEGRGVIAGRSLCDGCARPLGWAETVPFVGYALALGQCRACGTRISGFHVIGETLGALAFTVPLLLLDGLDAVVIAMLCLLLLVSALIDLKTFRLPDILTAGIALCAAALAVIEGHVISGLIACVLSASALLGIKIWLEHRHAKPMLGMGDIKLVGALGLWLGVRTPAMLSLAAIIALVVVFTTKRKTPVPFGPMIATATFIIGMCVPEGWLA